MKPWNSSICFQQCSVFRVVWFYLIAWIEIWAGTHNFPIWNHFSGALSLRPRAAYGLKKYLIQRLTQEFVALINVLAV